MTYISLFDRTGIACTPWAEAGCACYCYDLQNEGQVVPIGNGFISFVRWDALDREQTEAIYRLHYVDACFMSSFPPCTDLTIAGAKWFERKGNENPDFQREAMRLVYIADTMGRALSCPYYIENPVGVISTTWRKPDYIFDPYEYSGYLADSEAAHPLYEQITPKDYYPKRTCLWTGNGFVMPPAIYTKPPVLDNKFASFHMKLSGWMDKNERSNIRSATPRGFSIAVFMYNIENALANANHKTN